MKASSKKTAVKEDLSKETEEESREEPSIEEAEEAEVAEVAEKAEEEKAEGELEETEERAEEVAEKEVLEEAVEEEEAIEEEKEEEKPERIEKEVEEEIVEERIYTIPLSRAWISPPKKRAPRAIRIIKGFITRHMKIKTEPTEEAERLVISNEVNERIWSSGIKNPPRNIRIRAVKDKEGTITLHLAEED